MTNCDAEFWYGDTVRVLNFQQDSVTLTGGIGRVSSVVRRMDGLYAYKLEHDPAVYTCHDLELVEEQFYTCTGETVFNLKERNPKDAVGIKKPPLSTVPLPVVLELGTAMLEGARKYGRHNYRESKVRASVYFDATIRHLFSWWEGEDIDPDSGMSHVAKAIASLAVLRDAQINDKVVDDRPPSARQGWKDSIQESVNVVFEKCPESKPAHTRSDTNAK